MMSTAAANGIRHLAAAVLFAAVTTLAPSFGGDLWLKAECGVADSFLRLSALLEQPTADDRYDGIFLGEIPENGKKEIPLAYIRRRLVREGLASARPRVRDGREAVTVFRTTAPCAVPVPAAEAAVAPTTGAGYFVVLTQAVNKGSELTADLVELRKLERVVPNAATTKEQAVGRLLQKTKPKGSVLLKSELVQRPLVSRNDTVKITVERSGILLTGIGRAQSDGAAGDMIAVRRGPETLNCQVTGVGTVTVKDQ